MRVFAWSDLHLESRSNFDLVKEFCKLHHKRSARSIRFGSSPSEGNCSNSRASAARGQSRSTISDYDFRIPGGEAWPPLQTSRPGSMEMLLNLFRGAPSSPSEDFGQDVLILAGDVHYDMEGLKESLELFCSVFGHVAFVPGNHELWVTQKDRDLGERELAIYRIYVPSENITAVLRGILKSKPSSAIIYICQT